VAGAVGLLLSNAPALVTSLATSRCIRQRGRGCQFRLYFRRLHRLPAPASPTGLVGIKDISLPNYQIVFAGREKDALAVECDDLDAARNEAVRQLGTYLSGHPGFASEGHWRVSVQSETGRRLLHVATVADRNNNEPSEPAVPA
jgi:hypothetical protein